jgi:hypothetical protein
MPRVVNRLSPRNWPTLAVTDSVASAAAWWARSSSSGPVTRSWAALRRTSARATRSNSSWRRATAAPRTSQTSKRPSTQAADSASSAAPAGPAVGTIGRPAATPGDPTWPSVTSSARCRDWHCTSATVSPAPRNPKVPVGQLQHKARTMEAAPHSAPAESASLAVEAGDSVHPFGRLRRGHEVPIIPRAA